MNGPLSDESTGWLLAEAMHADVDAVVPPATLVNGLAARATRRRRAQLSAVGFAASLVLVAGALAVAAARPAPAPPAGRPTTMPSPSGSLEPTFPSPRMEATSLPTGFMYWNTEHATTNPGRSGVWPLVVTYARGFTDAGKPRTPIAVMTSVDAIHEIDLGDFDDPDARWVVIGSRRVVYAVNAFETVGYHWTEKPGVNVSVTAARGVADNELRRVIAGARLVTPAPSTSTLARLEPQSGTGVLLAETSGHGSRTIGPIAVPAEFDVHAACDGDTLRTQIGSLRDGTWGCDDPHTPFTEIVDRTNGIRSVTITLTADDSTTWAILVTTSAGHL